MQRLAMGPHVHLSEIAVRTVVDAALFIAGAVVVMPARPIQVVIQPVAAAGTFAGLVFDAPVLSWATAACA
jgi:hypothetical protein